MIALNCRQTDQERVDDTSFSAVADSAASWEVRYWESIGQVGPREKWGLVLETISLLDSEAVFT